MKMIEAALSYRNRNFSIVPVNPKSKSPLVPWKEYQNRLPSVDEVSVWWKLYPQAMISVVTGKISGITVVDADTQEAISRIEETISDSFKIPCTKTPRGGKHFYFSYNPDILTKAGVLPHIDTRNDGGCIVVPPSVNSTGVAYAWMPGRELSRDALQEMPASLAEILSQKIDKCADRLVEKYGKPYYFNGKGVLSSVNQSFWAGLYDAEHIIIYEPDEKSFYIYDENTGMYTAISEDLIKQEISKRMLEVSRENNVGGLETKRTNSFLTHVVNHLMGICEKRNAFKHKNKTVHLANGVLVFRDDGVVDLESFSPHFLSRNQSPITYDESAKCERFLNELIFPAVIKEDALLIQKYFGLCLLGLNLIQRFLILDGLGGRGKTQLALIIQHVVGIQNITQLRTRQLDERFELYRYLKKTLLVGVDVPGDFLSERGAHVIKGLVGGDWFDAEQKGGTGCFQMQGNFCIIITSNSRLQLRIYGDITAWKRRLLIVRFEAPSPKKKIPNFADLLIKEEGSGILNWALHGLGLLLEDIKLSGDIQMNDDQHNIVGALLAESDSLRHFLTDCVEKDEVQDLSVTEIVEAYAEYCPSKGWNAKPLTVVHKELEGLMLALFGTSKAQSINREGKSVRGFRRVRLKIRE